MPKTSAPSRKRQALELLPACDQVSAAQRLAGSPYSTLCRWRSDEFSKDSHLSEKKDFAISEKFSPKNDMTSEVAHSSGEHDDFHACLDAKCALSIPAAQSVDEQSREEEPVRELMRRSIVEPGALGDDVI